MIEEYVDMRCPNLHTWRAKVVVVIEPLVQAAEEEALCPECGEEAIGG